MAKQTEKLKKRFGFSRKRMSIIENIVLKELGGRRNGVK